MSEPTKPAPLKVKRLDGKFIVEFPVIIKMPVEFHEATDEAEAVQIARERFNELPLAVTLGGVPLDVTADFPIFDAP